MIVALGLLAWSMPEATDQGAALLGQVPFVVGYHRLHRDAALENGVRARLYEVVARQPGITIQGSSELAGVARTTAAYHLRILAREGLLVERPSRKTVHYYHNDGRFSEDQQLRLQALASPRTRHVAEVLAGRAGLQRSELGRLLGISIATVNWHLRPLAERGLVREEVRGRRRLLYPTDSLAEALRLLSPDRPVVLPSQLRADAGSPMPPPASDAGGESRGMPPAL